VGDLALFVVLRLHLPQFLHAEAEFLRLAALTTGLNLSIITLDSEPRTPSAMKTYLPSNSMPGWKSSFGFAVLADARHAGDDALHRAILAVEQVGAGKARIDLDAQFLGLLASQRQTLPSETA
jgi:hypothetical protein